MRTEAFIAGDWGTTQLRLFLCRGDAVLETRMGRGVGALNRPPEEEFAALTDDWLTTHRIKRVVLAGMVGSRNGWLETAYVSCPASFDDLRAAFGRVQHRELSISIVPGLSCVSPVGAPDVMRGEETQIFGALQLRADLARGSHIVALPGTHTKWVVLEDGRVMNFQTALSGELFALLRTHSTLLRTGTTATHQFDDAAFQQGLAQGADGGLLHRLFQVRSRQLIEGVSADQATSLLSGLLLAADVNDAQRLLDPKFVTLVCEPSLAGLYAQALRARGIDSQRLDGNECILAALRALADA
jgi:2-dehydro-3-deoxygalactonokinase